MRFRKKPVVIEARQVPAAVNFSHGGGSAWRQEFREAVNSVADWCQGQVVGGRSEMLEDVCIDIATLEGTMRAQPADWIIQGVHGEFYPCKREIFEQTYDRLPE